MPKFLDAPSWYDKEGSQRTIVTTMRIGMSNTGRRGYCNVPVISEGSASLDDIPEQPLYTLPFGSTNTGGVPYWSGTQNGYQLVAPGPSGYVLASDENGLPSWKSMILRLHQIYISGGTVGKIMVNVYSMLAGSLTKNSYSGFVEFLRNYHFTSITRFLVANGVAFYAAGARNVAGVYAGSGSTFNLVMTQVENSSYDKGLETTMVSSAMGAEITENILIMS